MRSIAEGQPGVGPKRKMKDVGGGTGRKYVCVYLGTYICGFIVKGFSFGVVSVTVAPRNRLVV